MKKKEIRSFDLIKEDFRDMETMSCKPSFVKPKNGAVIDEDKSVKWNREEVARLQAAYDEEVKRLNTEKNKWRDELYDELYVAIQNEVGGGISVNDASAIFWKAYERGHSAGYSEVFGYLNDLMDFVGDIVNHRNDKKK